MRLKQLDAAYGQFCYDNAVNLVTEFEFRRQSSWYFQSGTLVRLAQIAYAIDHPLDECRDWLRQATQAFRELFLLRGTTVSTVTKYKNGQPANTIEVADDGYTSKESFLAALVALALQDDKLARDLILLAGPSPNARLVSPQSEVCTSNEQTLSHALNALIQNDDSLAEREAAKLSVRRGSQMEKQIAELITAIATSGDAAGQLQALLSCHKKLAIRRDNLLSPQFWLCLPALGLASLALMRKRLDRSELPDDNPYFPTSLLVSDGVQQ